MNKKSIVVLIDWFLPGNRAGGPVKSVFSILNLLHAYFDFSVITNNKDLGVNETYKGIIPDTWTNFNEIPVYYFSHENFNGDKLAEVINSKQPDIVYLNSFWSYNFSILPLQLKNSGKIKSKIVLAPRGMLGKGALSIKPIKKKLFMMFMQMVKIHRGVTFHATTAEEEKEVRAYFKNAEIRIASNLNTMPILKNRISSKTKGQLKLFYLSRISRVKNLHFALEVLKSLPTQAQIVYDIYGSNEDEVYTKECEKIISTLPSNIDVKFKGELSYEQVQPTISNYHYLFLPTLNENFGHSIAETLKSGIPVVISTTTPWTKINEHHCGYAIDLSRKEEFVRVLSELAEQNNQDYQKISGNCIKFMEANKNDQKDIEDYIKLFN